MEFERPVLEMPKEMGFQSYEFLEGDGTVREAQKVAFMVGKVRNPTLDYPVLDGHKLGLMLHSLEPVLGKSRLYGDEVLGDVVYDSASYRMAEMYWLLEAERLNQWAVVDAESEEFKQSAARYQEANEQLYGKPDEALREMLYGEVLAQAHEKTLHPSAQHIYDQLVNGTTIYLERTQVRLPGMGTDYSERLPQDVKEQLSELKEVLQEQFADTIRITNEYWENVILPRGDDEPAFDTEDMHAVFTLVRDFYDPENATGIGIVIDPDKTSLAWDTPSMSVKIGAKRKKINDPTEMVSKIIHEYGVHGLRVVNGRRVNVPTFDTGMYSDANVGEQSDYLTFEEGFATLCEMAIDDRFTKWKSLHISHSMALNARYEGLDFRQAYERTWRARVLMDVRDGAEVTDKIIDTAKKQAYVSCVRVMRGTPTQLTDGPLLTFNKDLAYLGGKLDALKYLAENRGNKQAVVRLFAGKFDPNNSIQNSIAERYADVA